MVPPLLALFAWPLISIFFFWRLRLPLAVLVTIVGGFLLLPELTELNLPGFPALDKTSVPALTALVLALIFARNETTSDQRPKGLVPRHPLTLMLLAALVLGTVMTALTNTDALTYGPRRLPALRLYDAVAMAISALMMIIPFLLARRYLADPAAQRLLLQVLCVAALLYSLLALFEVRMSPQLNVWIYGFFPHSWIQHLRGGGFRPLVFLSHGLILGIFLSMATLATLGLARLNAERRLFWLVATLWLLGTLVLSRNFGALMITLALLPVVFFLGVRLQLLIAVVIAGVFLAYPVVRTTQMLPIAQVIQLAQGIDPQRVGSFQVRLDNEASLLAKASERPLFGWGSWGRQRIYDDAGHDISITDGLWIIVIGRDGWVGYLARFGLLTAPVFLLLLHRRRYDIGMETSVLVMILAANLIDMVPNAPNIPLTWLLAGALWGRLELQRAASLQETADTLAPDRPGYRRADPAIPATRLPQNAYTRQERRIERKRTVLKSGTR